MGTSNPNRMGRGRLGCLGRASGWCKVDWNCRSPGCRDPVTGRWEEERKSWGPPLWVIERSILSSHPRHHCDLPQWNNTARDRPRPVLECVSVSGRFQVGERNRFRPVFDPGPLSPLSAEARPKDVTGVPTHSQDGDVHGVVDDVGPPRSAVEVLRPRRFGP